MSLIEPALLSRRTGRERRTLLCDQSGTHPSQKARRMGHPLCGPGGGRLGHPPTIMGPCSKISSAITPPEISWESRD